ncbi:MAG: phosphatidylserine/phosphatidylglycerophosphate/cardiolipin synthase family protein [Spirochaetes bacterium]|nr:phosphatidylserine/phosphatidylglycerophosphate/cardiolipin synthase family protein [Spirochaetota bacterium]
MALGSNSADHRADPGRWSRERVFGEGDAWFDDICSAIRRARDRVWVETYLLGSDAIGSRLVAELLAAQRRGCEVRLLVDGFGSAAWLRDASVREALGSAGVSLRVWRPMPWALSDRVDFSRRLRWLAGINRRDHRKICLVDREAWVGSFNWVEDHSRKHRGKRAWRDAGARVRGPGVDSLDSAFCHAWRLAWPVGGGMLLPILRRGPRVRPRPSPWVLLNHNPWLRRASRRELLSRIGAAKRRIWITNAYFLPWGRLLRVLGNAARRGVSVRILFPEQSDHRIVSWATRRLSDALLKKGVEVFAFQSKMLHSKTMIIDGSARVGSHNLNGRSFLHDLECDVVLAGKASLRQMEKAWREDLSHAVPLAIPAAVGLAFWKRILANLALRLRKWL